jgi:hypothetical protein
MPQRDTSGIGERVPRELIFADFEVAFSLIEMATSEANRGNAPLVTQLLRKAEGMLNDIEGRLLRMTVAQRQTFEPRCDELREAIAKAVNGGSDT